MHPLWSPPATVRRIAEHVCQLLAWWQPSHTALGGEVDHVIAIICVAGMLQAATPSPLHLKTRGVRAEREARLAQMPAKKPCPGIATSCSGKCEKIKKDKGRTPDAPRRAARRRPRPGATWRPARRRARPRARPPRRWRRCACRPWPAAWRRPACSAPSAPRSRAAAGLRCTRRAPGAGDWIGLG